MHSTSRILEYGRPELGPTPARVTLTRLAGLPAGLDGGPAPDVTVAWQTPDGVRWWGLGSALSFEADEASGARQLPDRLRACLRELDADARAFLRGFGGMAFDAQTAGGWPVAAFWVPACLVRATGDEVQLAVTTWRQPGERDADLELRHARDRESYDARLAVRPEPQPWRPGRRREDAGARERWDHQIGEVLSAIGSHTVSKAVLARGLAIDFDGPPDLARVYQTLTDKAPGTDRLCLRPDAERAFVAASPEVLFAQVGTHLAVDCLAGTAPRGADASEDDAHAQALYGSAKERHEHQVVVDFVRDALRPKAATVAAPETPGLRKLATLQHLHTPVDATIDPAEPLATWLDALFPTPAVCGQPREAARQLIARVEDAPRGWYAGALGVVGADEARLVVGLRAAALHGNAAWVPAGAGIVAGSTAEGEWLETARKGALLAGLLEGGQP